MSRTHLLDFTTHVSPEYKPGRFHRALAAALDEVVEGSCKRLIVTAPPRHGKSRLVSQCLPPYFLGRYPGAKVFAASYSAAISMSNARAVKQIIELPQYGLLFPHVKLPEKNERGKVDKANEFDCGGDSKYVCLGVGAGTGGRGMTLGIIDDPYRNEAEASSPEIREKVWEWWQHDFVTRDDGDARIVILHTRWHADDLIGRLLRERGKEWKLINFPALDSDGTPLWPERFGKDWAELKQAEVGPRSWAALYQQTPVPSGGAVLRDDWFRFFKRDRWTITRPDNTKLDANTWQKFISVDVAMKEAEGNDYTVMACWAIAPDKKLYLMDLRRQRMDSPGVLRMLASSRDWFGPAVIYLETNGAGLPIFQMANEMKLPVMGYDMHVDKVVRANAASPWFARGDVWFAESAWTADLLVELTSFPFAAHDDQMDAISLGVAIADGLCLNPVRAIQTGVSVQARVSGREILDVHGTVRPIGNRPPTAKKQRWSELW